MLFHLIDSSFFTYLFPCLLLLSIGIGFYLAKRQEKRTGKPAKSSGIDGPVISFFALLISFTLASVGGSMKDRLSLIHQQSDGLANLYRETLTQPDSTRTEIKRFLIEHINIQVENRKLNEQVNDRMLVEIGENNARFLAEMKRQGKLSAILPPFQAMTSTTYKLIYSYDERMPRVVMVLLLFSSLLIGALIGFLNGSNQDRHYLAPLIYVVLVVLTIQAIRDLDNPSVGTVQPSYENLHGVKLLIEAGG
jgi:hypothetical protein